MPSRGFFLRGVTAADQEAAVKVMRSYSQQEATLAFTQMLTFKRGGGVRNGKDRGIGLQAVNHFVHLGSGVFVVDCVVTG